MTEAAAPPSEILKHCWTCRKETVHRHVQGIRSAVLYQCAASCGAAAREVTDPQGSTRVERMLYEMQAKKMRADLARDVERDDRQRWKKGGRAKALSRVKGESRAMPKPKKKTPLELFIEKKIDAKLGAGSESITEDRVREIVREELESMIPAPDDQPETSAGADTSGLLPKVTKETCPRRPHPGRCGKKCQAELDKQS